MSKPPTFRRSPRLDPNLPRDEVVILAPSRKPTLPSDPMRSMILQVILTAVILVSASVVMGSSTVLLFLPLSIVPVLVYGVRRREQRQEYEQELAERANIYERYLADQEERLRRLEDDQYEILQGRFPEPADCYERVVELHRSLWARVPSDEDFLELRLGSGERPTSISLKVAERENPLSPDPLLDAAHNLVRRFQALPEAPASLILREVGVVGVAGSCSDRIQLARSLIIQLATHHSPTEVKIAVIYSRDTENEEWAWARWLPHVWSNDRKVRLVSNDSASAHRLLTSLNDQLNLRRQMLLEYRGDSSTSYLEPLVVFIAEPDLVEDEPMMQRLQAEGPELNVFTIFLSDRVKNLPQKCQAVINLSREHWAGRPYLQLQTAREDPLFFTSDEALIELGGRFAKVIAPIRLKQASATEIPSALTVFDLLDIERPEGLDIAGNWRKNAMSSRTLATRIGMGAGNEPLLLDLHERAHGPNGLVAGMVGAGKSELLQTLIVSLAVHFPPSRLAFFIVDYKGGGMADPFRELPHIVGISDNLQDEHLAIRALTSLNVEARKRLKLFRDAGVTHIDDYQRRYYWQRTVDSQQTSARSVTNSTSNVATNNGFGEEQLPILPYLVIIVDEFAEMKNEQPEVAKEFVKLARIGRALGFRLILAMQKPMGIVDGQIEANTRFRLCLRVAQVDDSQAMLRRPEAAFLAQVGRAYCQVGVNEIFEQFQVAWSGAPYDPSRSRDQLDQRIIRIDLDGSRADLDTPVTSQDPSQEISQLNALVTRLRAVAGEWEEASRLPQLWLDPLPEHLTLSQVRPPEGWHGSGWDTPISWLEPIIGQEDIPEEREQPPCRISLEKDGHLIVYSAPGYGKTTFLQTLILSLALSHSPADVHFYLLDFGGRLLQVFKQMPHVGGVIVAGETERLSRLLRYLREELDRRKQRFGEIGANIRSYRETTGESEPAIVVVVDNYPNLVSDHEEAEETIAQIAREGGGYGVHLVLTSNTSAGLKFKIMANITMAIAMSLADTTELSSIVGHTGGIVPKPIPGRGIKKAKRPLEFQVALPVWSPTGDTLTVSIRANGQSDSDGPDNETDAKRASDLQALALSMNNKWNGIRPKSIDPLPAVVPLATILPPGDQWHRPQFDAPFSLAVPIGLTVVDLEPFTVSLDLGPHFLIGGPPQTGKTTLLNTWLLALAEVFHPDDLRFYFLDSPREGLTRLRALPHVEQYSKSQREADGLLEDLVKVLDQRQLEAPVAESVRKRHRHGGTWLDDPNIVIAVDDCFDPDDDSTSEEAKDLLGRLARQGGRFGFHLLVAGSTKNLYGRQHKEPVKTLKESYPGFAVGQSDDSVIRLRLPYREINQDLPIGEAYWTRRGQSVRIKLATADVGDIVLDDWVDRLVGRR